MCSSPAQADGKCVFCLNVDRQIRSRLDEWPETLWGLGVPNRYANGVGTDVTLMPELATWADGFAEGKAPWSVTIVGPNGTGKTWQAARLLGEVMTRRVGHKIVKLHYAEWVSSQALMESLRREIRDGEQSQKIEKMVSKDVLVIDDVWAFRETEWEAERLRLLLCQRYEQMAPATILTTDRSLSEVEPRIASRLAEGLVVKTGGPDMRRTPRKEAERG